MRNDGTYLAQLLQEQQRPHPMYMRQQYHFMGGPGWINDPNGLVWYKDAYHFFYQYNPFGLTWGEPCWGHAVSRDLLHWTQLPPALVPSEPYDMYEQGGCFSGSALVVGQRLYLLYTGVCEKGWTLRGRRSVWPGVTMASRFKNMKIIRSSARQWALIRQISAIQSSARGRWDILFCLRRKPGRGWSSAAVFLTGSFPVAVSGRAGPQRGPLRHDVGVSGPDSAWQEAYALRFPDALPGVPQCVPGRDIFTRRGEASECGASLPGRGAGLLRGAVVCR